MSRQFENLLSLDNKLTLCVKFTRLPLDVHMSRLFPFHNQSCGIQLKRESSRLVSYNVTAYMYITVVVIFSFRTANLQLNWPTGTAMTIL